jgi:predicted glycoside hydrolase/deacetylase ChbG (UPF0249 family)
VIGIQADDGGLCHAANVAFVELSHLGTITSGSVMVPCPWFPEIAEIAATDDVLDVGVHLTLNSEQTYYRWGPLSRPPASAGLVDDDGYLWRDVVSVRRHAHPDAVEAEWRAQIDRALQMGIDVTHLDAHMGSALAPEFCAAYVRVGVDYRVPVLLTSTLAGYGPRNHLADVGDDGLAPFVAAARDAGLPVFDLVLETDFNRPATDAADYERVLSGLDGQSVYCAFHPSAHGDVEFIEPATSHVRTDEYDLFSTPAWRAWLDASGNELVGMRALRDEWRALSIGGASTGAGS